jgi:hypothetical protein
MSDQSDAFNKLMREQGILVDGAAPAAPGIEENAGRPDLPYVKLPRDGHLISSFAKDVGAVLTANGLFRRENIPVIVDLETGRMEDMTPHRFRPYVETRLLCYREHFTKRGTVRIPTSMSGDEARTCLEADIFRYQLRKIQRVNFARQPVIRADGRIELLPKGYDDESQIFTMKDAIEPEDDWNLERAKLFLDDLLGEFPFADERSKAVHVVAMVTIYAAGLKPTMVKPLNFLYRSNMPRAGKGLLAQTAITPSCGPVSIQSIPESKEEFKKILDTEALNGSSYIFLDEIENRLVNRTLNSFLTTNIWGGRLMNTQKKFSVTQNSVVFLTGNNVDLSEDLAGRCLLVDLEVEHADPQSRRINRVMDELYLAKADVRRDCLSALWALVRHWCAMNRPKPSTVFRGFEMFSDIFGGIVELAGYGNPMASVVEEISDTFADMKALVEKLCESVQDRTEFQFSELIDACREVHAFEWHLEGKTIKGTEYEPDRFELTQSKKAWFGKLFSQRWGGTRFTLQDGRRVRFGHRGRNRHRRYVLEILQPIPTSTPASPMKRV